MGHISWAAEGPIPSQMSDELEKRPSTETSCKFMIQQKNNTVRDNERKKTSVFIESKDAKIIATENNDAKRVPWSSNAGTTSSSR